MSLDFVVLGADSSPEKTVSLGVELHKELLVASTSQNIRELLKFHDYYEDVEIGTDVLPALLQDAAILRDRVDSVELSDFLGEFMTLVNFAISQGKALHALAD